LKNTLQERSTHLLSTAISAALYAGLEILKIFNKEGGELELEYKRDNSPLTAADRNAHHCIKDYLLDQTADIPFLSEEGRDIPYEERKRWEYFWLVDPLDGTKEFIKRNGEFTVNIALIRRQKPYLGVVYVPVKDNLYFAACGMGSFRLCRAEESLKQWGDYGFIDLPRLISKAQRLPLPSIDPAPSTQHPTIRVAVSRSHFNPATEKFIEDLKRRYQEVELIVAGSSVKLCLVAEGTAQLHPRTGRTMEWDTAAGQAIVEQAGGSVTAIESLKPLLYNKENLENPPFLAESSTMG